MKRIGLIGEDPNDTLSIKNLLLQKHSTELQFKQLIKNKKGYQLDNSRVFAALKVEFEDYKPHFVLFIRDGDCLPSHEDKIRKVNDWYKSLNPIVNNKGILLINIYELEALILADISTFNKMYGTAIKYEKNVMYQNEPKEFLIEKTRKLKKVYSESHCPEIFKKLNFDMILTKSESFRNFYTSIKSIMKLK